MKNRIEAIEEYLKYFPKDTTAKNNLLLCEYANELDLTLNGGFYPRIEYCHCVINDRIGVYKNYYLTNSTTNYKQNGIDSLVVWSSNSGRLAYVRSDYWNDIESEWNEFMDVLKSYNPLDYDEINNNYIYDINNGKKLISDYNEIEKKFKEKLETKINEIKLNNKKLELERLKRELSDVKIL